MAGDAGIEPTYSGSEPDALADVLIAYMERVAGIEPASSAWQADILPLNYTRIWSLRSAAILLPS